MIIPVCILGLEKNNRSAMASHLSGDVRYDVYFEADAINGINEGLTRCVYIVCLADQYEKALENLIAVGQHGIDMVVSQCSDRRLMRRAMQLGVKDFLLEPIDAEELNKSIQQVYESKQRRNKISERRGKITAFMNAKGGRGSTFIASSIANILNEELNKSTVLLDYDMQFGDVCSYFDVDIPNGIDSALRSAHDLDAEALRGYWCRHDRGLNIMGPTKNELPLLEEIPADNVASLFSQVSCMADHVVIDMPCAINALTVMALKQVDHVYLVVQQNISDIKQAISLIKIFRDELCLDNKLTVLVNRFQKNAAIQTEEIKNTLNIRTVKVVPNDYRLAMSCLNDAVSIQVRANKSSLYKKLMALAFEIDGQSMDDKKGMFSKLFGG